MSKSWAKGSSRQWRRTRAAVLARDRYLCQLKLDGCTTRATQVHHVAGRAATGDDDPTTLVASCQFCNGSIGDRVRDPRPNGRTRW